MEPPKLNSFTSDWSILREVPSVRRLPNKFNKNGIGEGILYLLMAKILTVPQSKTNATDQLMFNSTSPRNEASSWKLIFSKYQV